MSENVGWTKPRQSFKLKKSGGSFRKVAAGRKEVPSLSRSSSVPQEAKPPSPGHNKRRNPFAQVNEDAQAEKKRRLNSFLSQDSGFHLSSSDSRDSGVGNSQSSDHFTRLLTGFNTQQSSHNANTDGHMELKPAEQLPLDWSLKSRVSFTSPQSWSWGEHLSTVEAASSVTGGVRCLNIAGGDHCLDTSASTQFHASCLYWQHPSLPGLTLYPRFGQTRLSKEKVTFSTEMHRHILSEWINSLQSVYLSVKAGQCPYFYVCHSTFTCLFRAAGVGGAQQMLALITPTTSGLRAALTREDVEFSMPLRSGEEATSDKEACGKAPEGEEEANDILETLGIEADSLPGFVKTNPKTMTQTGVQLDGKADSLVCVEGVECQSLLNWLLNAKHNQDPGGVPPTVLAPVAFPGASLKSLKVKSHLIATRGDGSKNHQIDVQGPILPHTLQTLTSLSVQNSPNTNIRLNTQESTVSFSTFNLPKDSVAPSAFGSANLKDCGLPDSLLASFCQVRSGSEQVAVMREIQFRDGKFRLIDTQAQDKEG